MVQLRSMVIIGAAEFGNSIFLMRSSMHSRTLVPSGPLSTLTLVLMLMTWLPSIAEQPTNWPRLLSGCAVRCQPSGRSMIGHRQARRARQHQQPQRWYRMQPRRAMKRWC